MGNILFNYFQYGYIYLKVANIIWNQFNCPYDVYVIKYLLYEQKYKFFS